MMRARPALAGFLRDQRSGKVLGPDILLLLTGHARSFLPDVGGIFRYADHLARKKGKLDMNSTY